MLGAVRVGQQIVLAKQIHDGIRAAAVGYIEESIDIPLLTTSDGWRIKLTALPTARYGSRQTGTVMQELWSRTWSGESANPLRDSLKKKGSRYGDQLAMPYVIALNSDDGMLTRRDFEETLFGERPEANSTQSHRAGGFWVLESERASCQGTPKYALVPRRFCIP